MTETQWTHPWNPAGEGRVDAASLETWVENGLKRYQQTIDGLVAAVGPRTPENTLRLL